MHTELATGMEKIITTYGSIGAIFISALAIYFATKDNKKQIISNKVEEIYAITLSLFYHYQILFFLNGILENYHDENYDSIQRDGFLKSYKAELGRLKEQMNFDELYDKTSRLKVLANAYLENTLKLKVLAYNDLLEKLMASSLKQQMLYKSMFYPEGFPSQEKMYYFVLGLEKLYVEKLQLGGKDLSPDDLENYRENKFKKDLGLK